jgi:hypothetical protein
MIRDIKPAKQIMDEMIADAIAALRHANSLIVPKPRL